MSGPPESPLQAPLRLRLPAHRIWRVNKTVAIKIEHFHYTNILLESHKKFYVIKTQLDKIFC
jgi:hypothetical protein